MFDKFATHMRNMNEAVFVNPDINEGTEVNDITDHTFKLLSDNEILDIQNILTENWSIKRITEITTRF